MHVLYLPIYELQSLNIKILTVDGIIDRMDNLEKQLTSFQQQWTILTLIQNKKEVKRKITTKDQKKEMHNPPKFEMEL